MKKLRQSIAFKSIASIVLLLVLFAVIVILIGSGNFTNAIRQQYADNAFHTARIASYVVDGDLIDEYWKSNGVTKEYEETKETLRRLCNSSNSTFIYVIEPDRTDYGHIRFLFSTMNRHSTYKLYEFGHLRETTNEEYKTKYRAICEGGSQEELVVRDKGYIETDAHITAMIPLTADDGQVKGILCVQQQLDILLEARNVYLRRVVIVLIALSLLVIIGMITYLNLTLLRPIKQISAEAGRFAKVNKANEEKLQQTILNRDEIGSLAGSIDQMEEQIEKAMDDLQRFTAERERITTELNLASRIQASMLPSVFPPFPDRTEFDIFASMNPAKEVGGDFYDFILIDDDHLCVMIADVSGKGIPAALFMMASKIILESCAMLGKSAAEILTRTNEAICSNNEEEMFITVWLGILEISTGILTAANAGHEYPILKRADGNFELFKDKHDFVIGTFEDVTYNEYRLQLYPGDKIFVYTDGLPEATTAENLMFGTERILTVLNRTPEAGPQELLERMQRSVDTFVRDAKQFDDLTMLCLEYKG